jgi:uncharacterized protein (DUF342 family)
VEENLMSTRYEDLIEIIIESDEMAADIFLTAVDDPDFYIPDKIIDYLEDKGIKAGIIYDAIKEMTDSMIFGRFVNIARGKLPIDGRDGYFDFMFDTRPSKTPKLNSDGTVDYKNLNLIQVVEKDQLIARYIKKTDGIDGFNVLGDIIESKKGKDLPPLRGKGFRISEDESEYYAEINGKIELNLGHITIKNVFVISKDVDLETGNIDFRGDIEISGDVKAGMVVKTTGSVTINGLVETAVIEAGKDVLIKGGVLGGNKARIIAGGNIFALFIENAKIRSDNCVQADSIINSDVIAYKDINVFGKTSKIVGGRLKANREVRTKVLGSDVAVKTEIEVGVDLKSYNIHKSCKEELEKMELEFEKLEKLVEKLNEVNKPENAKILTTILRTKIELSADMSKKRALYEELGRQITIGRDAHIIAEERVFPGVDIIVDGIKLKVDDEFEEIVFLRKGDKILSRRYSEDMYKIKEE